MINYLVNWFLEHSCPHQKLNCFKEDFFLSVLIIVLVLQQVLRHNAIDIFVEFSENTVTIILLPLSYRRTCTLLWKNLHWSEKNMTLTVLTSHFCRLVVMALRYVGKRFILCKRLRHWQKLVMWWSRGDTSRL